MKIIRSYIVHFDFASVCDEKKNDLLCCLIVRSKCIFVTQYYLMPFTDKNIPGEGTLTLLSSTSSLPLATNDDDMS